MTLKSRQKISPDEQAFADGLWQDVVKPVAEYAEKTERFNTLIVCHAHLMFLVNVMQTQRFNPFLTAPLLNSYLHTLEGVIEKLHQEIADDL